VVFISIDDLNDWVEPFGGYEGVQTPHISALARQAVVFKRAYTSAPFCNSARVSTLTGCLPTTTGVYWNQEGTTPPALTSLPEYFKSRGYATLGAGKVFHPWEVGKGMPLRFRGWNPEAWTEYADSLERRFPPSMRSLSKSPVARMDIGALSESESTPDLQIAKWAEERLSKPVPAPFFLAVGFNRPHLPWFVPKKYFEMYPLDSVRLPSCPPDDLEDIPAIARAHTVGIPKGQGRAYHDQVVAKGFWKNAVQGYLASVSYADEMVGRVLGALESGPHRRNTVVVLWSDHGYHLGEKLRWSKYTLWERSTRIPLIIRLPGGGAPRICEEVVSLVDLFPTLTELCFGTAPEKTDGSSLLRLSTSGDPTWRDNALTFWRKGNSAIRTRRWRLIRYADGAEELYDHDNDPQELRNLIVLEPEANAAIAKELRDRLQTASTKQGPAG
ncbi:MAG TPA: sulfatase, partial [Bdellovibrionota bacterium]|nr:sulfatase [Bdellovibrionota bacterium]